MDKKSAHCLLVLIALCGLILTIGCTPAPRYTSKIMVPLAESSPDTPALRQKPDSLNQAVPESTINTVDRPADAAAANPVNNAVDNTFVGKATYYAHEFHGRKTASGERFNMNELTAAHKSLPFNTQVRVTNISNQKSVVVRVNDRGPFCKGCLIDLSYRAAQEIDMIKSGITQVKIEILRP